MQNETQGHADENIRKIGELIHGIKIALLTTIGADGHLSNRPMAVQQVEFDGDLWFFSYEDSLKVLEIRENPHVGVVFA